MAAGNCAGRPYVGTRNVQFCMCRKGGAGKRVSASDPGLAGGRVELGEEPGQGAQVVLAEWGEWSGVGDEVVPELVA